MKRLFLAALGLSLSLSVSSCSSPDCTNPGCVSMVSYQKTFSAPALTSAVRIETCRNQECVFTTAELPPLGQSSNCEPIENPNFHVTYCFVSRKSQDSVTVLLALALDKGPTPQDSDAFRFTVWDQSSSAQLTQSEVKGPYIGQSQNEPGCPGLCLGLHAGD